MQLAKDHYSLEELVSVSGKVVQGRKIGREINFPTANIGVATDGFENGVYGVYVSLNGEFYRGVMNIGVKPSFGSQLKKTMEVHILNFHNDIYGQIITCQLIFKVREERKFPSIELLKQQISRDILDATQKFNLIGLANKIQNDYRSKQDRPLN
ncbi:riboflavin kinase [Bacillus sp. 1NLA3E]|uniref:riboflavin kinase n=1 Tax=Bacillus sp. 1NLA3E TaxID=666686 RepID=UPI000247F126|nr:riboflavin kinase [Bacillus sp. 1NLA3E]AGK55562.1 RNA-binding riboflavin kinase [Bacillus sp. 1NLA3E]